MNSFAEFERDLIVEHEGKVIAKQRDDFREGGPTEYSKKQLRRFKAVRNSFI